METIPVNVSFLTNKGKQKISVNAFEYRLEKLCLNRLYWACLSKDSVNLKCKARLITSSITDNSVTILDKSNNAHCHNPPEVSSITSQIKHIIQNNNFAKTSSIIHK